VTEAQSQRLTRPLVAIYWLTLLGGLVLFTATHSDSAVIAALWTGAVGGTLLGQYLAFHNFRLWIAVLCIAAALLYCAPLVSLGEASTPLWESFVPAALCGFWALGDRSALAAVWFPTVVWMLTILDRSDRTALGGPGAILLGAIAALFVCFLYVRESRRIALWHSVGAEPIAPAAPAELLREPPGRQLARAAWSLSIGALTVAITVWLVPPLWHSETLGGPPARLAGAGPGGRPCCPAAGAETHSTRIKEYLDLGLGHGADVVEPVDGVDCRRCAGPATVTAARGDTPVVARTPGAAGSGGAGPVTGRTSVTARYTGSPGRAVASGSSYVPPGEPGPGPAVDVGDPADAPAAAVEPGDPTRVAPDPWRPAAAAPASPPVAAPPAPPPARVPAPTWAPPRSAGASGPPTAQSRELADLVGPSLAHWLIFAVVAAVVSQLVRLGLRPLRRLVTLRHLRRPFWDETVAQRVSNAWQLALVGLRDAGWRTGPGEPPRDLAHRTRVDGLDHCATILERARHGVGLDAGDLAEMQTSADTAYHTARTGLGGLPRLLAWLRWPLT